MSLKLSNESSILKLREELMTLLREDSTDSNAANYLLKMINTGQISATMAVIAYREAIREVYFRKVN